MKKTALIIISLILATTATAQLSANSYSNTTLATYDFKTTQDTPPRQIQAYHGETFIIRHTFPQGYEPQYGKFHWQTNGMNETWYTDDNVTKSANVLSYKWTPENDNGANTYRYFLEAVNDGNAYRANGIIRMTPSPGFLPATVTLPPSQYQIISNRLDIIDDLNASYTYHLRNGNNPHETTLQQVIEKTNGDASRFGNSIIAIGKTGISLRHQLATTQRSIIQLFDDEASCITIYGGKTAKIGTKKQTDGTAQAYITGTPLNLDTANPPTQPNHATTKSYVDTITAGKLDKPNIPYTLEWEPYIGEDGYTVYYRLKAASQ